MDYFYLVLNQDEDFRKNIEKLFLSLQELQRSENWSNEHIADFIIRELAGLGCHDMSVFSFVDCYRDSMSQ